MEFWFLAAPWSRRRRGEIRLRSRPSSEAIFEGSRKQGRQMKTRIILCIVVASISAVALQLNNHEYSNFNAQHLPDKATVNIALATVFAVGALLLIFDVIIGGIRLLFRISCRNLPKLTIGLARTSDVLVHLILNARAN